MATTSSPPATTTYSASSTAPAPHHPHRRRDRQHPARVPQRPKKLPRHYLAAGHVTHGYTMTIHKAQGMTTHSSFVLADEALGRAHAYTALFRGTNHNAIYIADSPRRKS